MAQFLLVGALTYSNATNRNTVLTQINTVLAGYAAVTGMASTLPSGVNTSGTTGLTISLLCPDDATAIALHNGLIAAWSASARSAGYVSLVRLDT